VLPAEGDRSGPAVAGFDENLGLVDELDQTAPLAWGDCCTFEPRLFDPAPPAPPPRRSRLRRRRAEAAGPEQRRRARSPLDPPTTSLRRRSRHQASARGFAGTTCTYVRSSAFFWYFTSPSTTA